ncbi:amidase [Thermoleophilia bacterium SCSIO 60948]|nr:amidase [Thermoleophilia bacterium SCSIO 60948]
MTGVGAGALAAPAAARRRRRSTSASELPSVAEVRGENLEPIEMLLIQQAVLLQAGELTSVELTQDYLDRIAEVNGPFETYGDNGLYNAFVRIDEEGALAAARAADRRLRKARRTGEAAPLLCGIPMGLKDSVATRGFRQLNGTVAYEGNVALDDSFAVAKLRAQGAVPLGITIASAFSGTIAGTFSSNAWDLDYVPGGSSRGSGVAPIARMCSIAMGEETGGSIIFPAACNGASAIKPSLGLASTSGVMPLSPGLDTIGPIGRSARDCALFYNAILGEDPFGDPLTLAVPPGFGPFSLKPRSGSSPLAGITIGINKTDWLTTPAGVQRGVDPQSLYGPDSAAAFERLIGELEGMGATVVEFNGVDYLDYSEESNPYYTDPTVLQTIDNYPVTPQAAVVNSNRYDIHYTEAIRDFAQTRSDEQESLLLAQYGRQPGSTSASGTGTKTWEAAIQIQADVSVFAREEGERRRRKFAANYKQAFDDAGSTSWSS